MHENEDGFLPETAGMTEGGKKMDAPRPMAAGSRLIDCRGGRIAVACRCVGLGWAQFLRSAQDDKLGGMTEFSWIPSPANDCRGRLKDLRG